MKTYRHLNLEERNKISILQAQGKSRREIAKTLGRNVSTISRELNRENVVTYRGNYVASATHDNVMSNKSNTHKRPNRFLAQRNVSYFIECELKRGYSPEIICHELLERFEETVSHETLYQYIYKKGWKLAQYLLRSFTGRKPKKTERPKRMGTGKNIPNRIDISERPIAANERTEFGHFEADSIESCKIKGQTLSNLTVITERVSRYTIIMKTASKTATATTLSIVTALKPLKNNIISITYDNGSEFSQHEKINKELNTKSYFARPYCSNDKGTVENINGLIRRFFPKGTNFDTISDEAIAYVEDWINNRPMKILNYMTPKQKFQQCSVALAS